MDIYEFIGRSVVVLVLVALIFMAGTDFGQFSCAKYGRCAGYAVETVASQSQTDER